MELKGLVTNILEKRSGTSKAGNAWVSQDYVIEIEGGGNYPRHMCFCFRRRSYPRICY